MEVFDYFGGGDEVVGLVEGGGVARVEWIIERDGVARFFEHDGERWAGSAAKVKANAVQGKLGVERFEDAIEEASVAHVVRRIFMQVVLCFFGLGREEVARRHVD